MAAVVVDMVHHHLGGGATVAAPLVDMAVAEAGAMMSTMVVLVLVAGMAKVVMAVHLEATRPLRTPMLAGMADHLEGLEKTRTLGRVTPSMVPMAGWHTEHQTLAKLTTTITRPTLHSGTGQQTGWAPYKAPYIWNGQVALMTSQCKYTGGQCVPS